MGKILTRMGGGISVEITESELRRDREEGAPDAAQRAHITPLSDSELTPLFNIYLLPVKFIGVEVGEEVILSIDK